MTHPWKRVFKPRQAKDRFNNRDLGFFVERSIHTANYFESCEYFCLLEAAEIEEWDLNHQDPDPPFIDTPTVLESVLPLQWSFV